MNSKTTWLASIYQRYFVDEIFSVLSPGVGVRSEKAALIISLRVTSKDAQGAVNKAEEWLKASGIKSAYVSDVGCADIADIDSEAPPLSYSYEADVTKTERADEKKS